MDFDRGFGDGPAKKIVVVGAGPAGLAAALEVVRSGHGVEVFEKSAYLGGLARTEVFNGNRFDLGPHRFFTLNPEIRALFQEVCGADVLSVPRLTRIYYKSKFFNYPITPINAMSGLGIVSGSRAVASYAVARLRRAMRPRPIETFEDWVTDRFGSHLFKVFFKTYTEKVWGIPCTHISAEWAAQRIKGLSLAEAIGNALFKSKGKVIKTLIDEFMYPRLGAGQLYEKMADLVRARGGRVHLNAPIVRMRREGFHIAGVSAADGAGSTFASGDFYLSSAPLTVLLEQLDPPPPAEIREAAAGLRYRNHISVQLVMQGEAPFFDNWIYVHSPDVRMARLASYRSFSQEMAAAADLHPITVEYFCFENDDLWSSSDRELLALAQKELAFMRIGTGARLVDGFVIRSPCAYPVIEAGCAGRIARIKEWLDRFDNLLPIGRGGMFKYNNQDHAMATGLLAARTAIGAGTFDPWLVNIDAIYHESGTVEAEDAVG